MKLNKSFLITAAICMLMACFGDIDLSRAQDAGQADIDQIVQGFEDEAPASADLEDLMQGFQDETAAEKRAPTEEDEFLQGFDEQGDQEILPSSKAEKPQSWSIEGELAFTAAYNFSSEAEPPWRGFSMVRPEAEFTLKNKFSDRWQAQVSVRGFYDLVYGLRGRENYTPQVLDEYEKELELKDTFIQGRLTAHLDTKIGRQVVVWGTLDNLRVTDVLNPLDLRVPGMTDIDDLRLPVTMVKLDYYFSDWAVSAMAIPEVRFSKWPVFGSDFFPAPVPLSPKDEPDNGFEDGQYAAALSGVFSGWDIGFYGADIYADQTYAEPVSPALPAQLVRKHARVKMLGSATNLAIGNWLLKAEVAWLDDLRYTNTPGSEYTRIDLGGGVEYTGFSEATVSLEAANRHIRDYDSRLEQAPDEIRKNEFQWALRFTKDFINDTLTLTLLASTFGIKADDGAFERLDAEYDITDALAIRGGIVLYQAGDKGLFQDVDGNDRCFVVMKYHF